MKKLLALPVIALLAIPAFAGTATTTTRTYDSSVDTPVMGIQSEEERVYDGNALTIDELEQERMEERRHSMDNQQRMENDRRLSPDGIDYYDRTRTNRERKALNTSSDASDDQ